MQVRLLVPFRCWERGETLEVSPQLGQSWISARIAEAVAVPVVPETAMLAPGERAILPPARARRPVRG